jgi:hypothetical protein
MDSSMVSPAEDWGDKKKTGMRREIYFNYSTVLYKI